MINNTQLGISTRFLLPLQSEVFYIAAHATLAFWRARILAVIYSRRGDEIPGIMNLYAPSLRGGIIIGGGDTKAHIQCNKCDVTSSIS